MKISSRILGIPALFFLIFTQNINAQCTGSGGIDTSFGNPALLDRDSDGDIVDKASVFSGCNVELSEFEQIVNPSGCIPCQVPWTPIGTYEPNADLWTGGDCGNTDIVTDTDGGNDFGYFSIADPDGVCNNGDEVIAFRLRISNNFNGNYSFDFLISNDGLVGTDDPDGINCCSKIANTGFEYEVQLKTGGSGTGVNVFDIDGVAGTDNCPGNNPCASYSLANNAQKSMACGSECGCRSAGSNNPVFLTFFVLLTDIGVDCQTFDLLTLVPLTSTSGNPVISSCTSVSDIGGISDDVDADCPECEGVTYSGCSNKVSKLACGLICAANNNAFEKTIVLPIELIYFNGYHINGQNHLTWATASEENTEWHIIQRSADGINNWTEIGRVPAAGNSNEMLKYEMIDRFPLPTSYYRLMNHDFNGSIDYSRNIIIQSEADLTSEINVFPVPTYNELNIRFENKRALERDVHFQIYDKMGSIRLEERHIAKAGLNHFAFDLSKLPHGMYFIHCNDGTKSRSMRIVKNDLN